MDIAQIAFILNRQGGPFSELKFKHISQNQVPIYHDDENEHHNDYDDADLCPCSLKTPSQNNFLIVDFRTLCWGLNLISTGASVGSKEWPSCKHDGHGAFIEFFY